MGKGRVLFLHTKLGKIDHFTSALLRKCQVVKPKFSGQQLSMLVVFLCCVWMLGIGWIKCRVALFGIVSGSRQIPHQSGMAEMAHTLLQGNPVGTTFQAV